MKNRILIAGGSGLIGSAISEEAIRRGFDVIVLSRKSAPGNITWNPSVGEINLPSPAHFDVIINLAGASIASRWSQSRIEEMHDSRINACRTIEKYLAKGLLTTKVYIGTSAIGIYGDHGNDIVDEKSHLGEDTDWMVTTGKAWEEGHIRMTTYGIRSVVLRTGIVLSHKGGALKEILQTAPFGIIGYFGNGKQFWSWIHMDDLVEIFFRAIQNESMSGLYLAASPGSVTNKELSKAASNAFQSHRLVVPVPVFFMAILLGKMRRMLLQSCRGYPARLLAEGFSFQFTSIQDAMKDLIRKRKMKM
ncbi:MAG TPA: TIGR01777 family oxidoreductase [Saprospiraceae bacterium]